MKKKNWDSIIPLPSPTIRKRSSWLTGQGSSQMGGVSSVEVRDVSSQSDTAIEGWLAW